MPTAPELSTIGSRIKAIRTEQGLSQAKFAAAISVKQPSVVAWEKDQSTPLAPYIEKISSIYHIYPEWIQTGEGPMHIPLSRAEQAVAVVTRTMIHAPESDRARLIELITSMSDEDVKTICNHFRRAVGLDPID